MKLSDIPPRYRAQVAKKSTAALGRLADDADCAGRIDAGDGHLADREADLQADAEQWLEGLGYWRRSAATIAAGRPPVGWQIHIHAAQRNPLLLDLLLLHNDGTWIELELKTRPTSRVATHQRQLIDQDPGRRHLCCSVHDVAAAIESSRIYQQRQTPRPRHD